MSAPVITIGGLVRIYYDDGAFDEGEVSAIASGRIEVDFYDWVERWTSPEDFNVVQLYLECADVLTPITKGQMVRDYRL